MNWGENKNIGQNREIRKYRDQNHGQVKLQDHASNLPYNQIPNTLKKQRFHFVTQIKSIQITNKELKIEKTKNDNHNIIRIIYHQIQR